MIRISALTVSTILAIATATAQTPTITESSVHDVLGRMSLEQKARMVVGTKGTDQAPSHYTPGAAGWTYPIHSLGIPSLNLADGPVGPRINPTPWEESIVVYDSNGIPTETSVKNIAGAPGEEIREGKLLNDGSKQAIENWVKSL